MDIRMCEQCGEVFSPRREHARFCSARCRVAWNRVHTGASGAEGGALGWAVTAMGDTCARLGRIRPKDQVQGVTVISEAVWWVTIVDATLVRYHPDIYDGAMAGQADRLLVEGTLAGLRFVRNQMGYHADPLDFVTPSASSPATTWRWKPAACPSLEALPTRGQEWEASRHEAYQKRLAGHSIGETFRRTAGFLSTASASIVPG